MIAVLEELGDTAEQAAHFIEATTLDEASADEYLEDFEIPVPLYIDFSKDFSLLPCFGALLNPIAGIVRSLRATHRPDWDRAVEGREGIFRSDLCDTFPPPRFLTIDKGIRIRRDDGSLITDIDGVMLDRENGSCGLFQFKWHDIFGRSLRERNSRRLNLLKANDWVGRVSEWLNARTPTEIVRSLGLGDADVTKRPQLFVVSRYAAQFSGNDEYDARAAWLGWADVIRTVPSDCAGDVIEDLARTFCGGIRKPSLREEPQTQRFSLPGLDVEVRWR